MREVENAEVVREIEATALKPVISDE